jgi:hypothetical protein
MSSRAARGSTPGGIPWLRMAFREEGHERSRSAHANPVPAFAGTTGSCLIPCEQNPLPPPDCGTAVIFISLSQTRVYTMLESPRLEGEHWRPRIFLSIASIATSSKLPRRSEQPPCGPQLYLKIACFSSKNRHNWRSGCTDNSCLVVGCRSSNKKMPAFLFGVMPIAGGKS